MLYDDDPDIEVFDLQSDSQARRRTISKDREALAENGWGGISKKEEAALVGGRGKSHESPPSAAPSIYQQLVGLLGQDNNNNGKYSYFMLHSVFYCTGFCANVSMSAFSVPAVSYVLCVQCYTMFFPPFSACMGS